MRHIWNLLALVGSIWVAWINENLLRGRSFWEIKISLKYSRRWRKLLKLRELTTQFIRSSLGDGKKNYGWIGGILMIFFTPATSYGYIVVYDAASSLKAKVSSVCKEKNSLEATLVNSLVSTQYKLLLIVD